MNWDTHERRKFVRASVPCKITIRNSQNQPFAGKTENIGAGGIRFIINQKLKIDSILNLEISDIKDKPIECKINVKWIFNRSSSLFDVGAEFYEIDSNDLSSIKKFIGSIVSNNSNQDEHIF